MSGVRVNGVRVGGVCGRCVWGAYAVRALGHHLRHRDDLLSPPPLSCGRRASSKSRVCRRRCGRSGAGGARLWQFLGAANQLPKKQDDQGEESSAAHQNCQLTLVRAQCAPTL